MPFGKYEFLMIPFGLAQAPAYFQLLMNQVLEGLTYAMTYLDDIIILVSCTEEFQGTLFFLLYVTNTETNRDVHLISSD